MVFARRTLSIAAAGTLTVKVVGLALALAVNVVAARALGPNEFGRFAVLVAVLNVLALTGTLGAPTLIVRTVGNHLAKSGDLASLRKFAGRLIVRVMAFVGLAALPALAYMFVTQQLDVFGVELMSGMAIVGGGFAVAIILASFVSAKKAVVEGQVLQVLLRPLLFLTALGLLWWVGGQEAMSVRTLGVSFVLAGALTTALALVGFGRHYHGLPAIRGVVADPVGRGLLIFAFMNAAQVLNANVHMLLLGGLGTPEDAGLFRVAFSLATLTGFPLAAASSAFGPWYSELFAREDFTRLRQLVGWSGLAVTGATVLMAILLFGWGSEILAVLFGERYGTAAPALMVLVAGQVINALAGPVALLLNLMHDEKFVFGTLLGSLFVSIFLNTLLIPQYGALGAAISSASALTLWNLVLVGRAMVSHSINPTATALRGRKRG